MRSWGRFPLLMGAWLIILALQQAIVILMLDTLPWSSLETRLVVVLVTPLYASQHSVALKAIREEPTSICDLIRGDSRWGTLIGVAIVTGVVVVTDAFLVVVPGIVRALMLIFAPIAALDAQAPEGEPKKLGVLFRIAFALAIPWILMVVLLSIKASSPELPIPSGHWRSTSFSAARSSSGQWARQPT